MITALIAASGLTTLSHATEANLDLSSAWVRPTLGAGRTTAAYVSITNNGETTDRLVATEMPYARSVEIHTAGMEGGIMRMRRIEGLDIAPGETVHLAPGGIHIMAIDLSEPLKSGDEVALTLIFEQAGAMNISATVSLAAPSQGTQDTNSQDMMTNGKDTDIDESIHHDH